MIELHAVENNFEVLRILTGSEGAGGAAAGTPAELKLKPRKGRASR